MSLGILTLKIGLVATVVGTSIATPILLNRGSSVAEGSQSLQVIDSRLGEAGRYDMGRVGSLPSEEHSERAGSPAISSDLSHSGSSMSLPNPAIKTEEFDKKCFVVPASAQGENENIQLLTCYDPKETIREGFVEEQPEYDSIFHIFDTSKTDNPVKINQKLEWNPTKQQLTAKLESNSEEEYIFTASGGEWGGISENKTVSLLGRECAIYKVPLEVANSEYLLACGDYFSDYEPESPEGIPLTNWEKERQLS